MKRKRKPCGRSSNVELLDGNSASDVEHEKKGLLPKRSKKKHFIVKCSTSGKDYSSDSTMVCMCACVICMSPYNMFLHQILILCYRNQVIVIIIIKILL